MALPLNIDQYAVTIGAGASLSGSIAMGADTLVGLVMPSAWTAAGLSFQVSADGGTTWVELCDTTGTLIALSAAASHFVQVAASNWRGINMIKVRSGTAAAPVNQTLAATIVLIGRPEIF
jgi:hypothetical protein